MSDVIQALTVKKPSAQEALAIKREQANNAALAPLNAIVNLDWHKIPPPMLVELIKRKPFKGGQNEPDFYLTDPQAWAFAVRAYELDLSPFSNEIWFNAKTWTVNVTTEGKKKLARRDGYNFGPPKYERMTRPMPETATKLKSAGFKEDVGYRCTMEVKGFKEPAEYTAWLSEWYGGNVWKEKPEHMLQVRAMEKAMSMSSGIGASEMPDDRDLVTPSANLGISSTSDVNVETTEFTYKEQKENA